MVRLEQQLHSVWPSWGESMLVTHLKQEQGCFRRANFSKLIEMFLPHLQWSHIQAIMCTTVHFTWRLAPCMVFNSQSRRSFTKKRNLLTKEALSSFVCGSSFHPQAVSGFKVVLSSVLSHPIMDETSKTMIPFVNSLSCLLSIQMKSSSA